MASSSPGSWLLTPGSYLALVIAIAVVGLPLVWMLLASVKTLDQIDTFPPVWIPPRLRWENYVDAWSVAPFGKEDPAIAFKDVAATLRKEGAPVLAQLKALSG